MTVIAHDGINVAIDRCANSGDFRFEVEKFQRLKDGRIVLFTGRLEHGLLVAAWLEEGADREKHPKFLNDDWCRLIVLDRGTLTEYEATWAPQPVTQKFMAWGSGRDFAMGAMSMGATAKEAVEVANRHCSSCGFGVDVFPVRKTLVAVE